MGGAAVTVLQTFVTLPTVSSTGQVSYQAGYTAWMGCYLNLLHWGTFPLQLAPDHTPTISTTTSFQPFWYDGTIVLGLTLPIAQLIVADISDSGSGYTSPPTVTNTNPAAVGMQLQALLNGSGGVAAVAVNDPGFNAGSGDVLAFSGGGGSGAAGTLIVPQTQFSILVYAQPPQGYSQWAGMGDDYLLVGPFAFGINTPDWAALLTAALGTSPQFLAPCKLKIVWVDRTTGLTGYTSYATLNPQGSIACIVSWSEVPPAGTYQLDFSGTDIDGASVTWAVASDVDFTFTINSPGLNGASSSYTVPVTGLSGAYTVTVGMWAAGGDIDCPS
jgi:hypothetical protein